MTLYFVNGSRQMKKLMESDYADDLYDVMMGFFEEHGKYPHFLETERVDDGLKIRFESQCEYFYLQGAEEEECEEYEALVREGSLGGSGL